eukprot:SAG25_NODE_113_length_14872_cov_23.149527_10_plen_116_part_00
MRICRGIVITLDSIGSLTGYVGATVPLLLSIISGLPPQRSITLDYVGFVGSSPPLLSGLHSILLVLSGRTNFSTRFYRVFHNHDQFCRAYHAELPVLSGLKSTPNSIGATYMNVR